MEEYVYVCEAVVFVFGSCMIALLVSHGLARTQITERTCKESACASGDTSHVTTSDRR